MTTTNTKRLWVCAAVFSVSMLSACGDSDLEEIHEQELNDAIASLEAPEMAAASPDNEASTPASPDNEASTAASPETEASTPANIDLSLYDLTFSDEFNAMSLDASKWNTILFDPDTVIFEQLQYYVDIQDEDEAQIFDSPFSFNGDHLTISATQTPDEQRSEANEQPYLSGILTTRNKLDITYGYIEARVDVEEGLGIWPSLWMLASGADGLLPEIYVFEHDGGRPDSVFHNYNYVDDEGLLRSPGQQEIEATGFSDNFHTVGLQWSPGELLFFIDGQASYRIIGDKVPAEDMYLIFSLAIGGIWTGAPDATTPDPAKLSVDYIRVYQLKDQ